MWFFEKFEKSTSNKMRYFLQKYRTFLFLGLISLITILVYSPILGTYFICEDFIQIPFFMAKNSLEQILGLFTTSFMETSIIKFYRPISDLIYTLETFFWKTNPFGYHFTHLLFHIFNMLMVYTITRTLLNLRKEEYIPLTAAILFAVHPISFNPIGHIACYANVFVLFFMLGSIQSFILYIKLQKKSFFIISLLSFWFALGSYEQAAILPLIFLACHLFIKTTNSKSDLRFYSLITFYLSIFASLILYFLLRKHILGFAIGGYKDIGNNFFSMHLLEKAQSFLKQLLKLLHPSYLENFNNTFFDILIYISVTILILILLLLTFSDRSRKWHATLFFCFIFTWIFIGQIPFNGIFIVAATGRYLYFSSVASSMFIAYLIWYSLKSVRLKDNHFIAAGVFMVGIVVVMYILQLNHYNGFRKQAGTLVRNTQAQILELSDSNSDQTPVFIANYPPSLNDPRCIIFVYAWSLSHTFKSPFTQKELMVYPVLFIESQDFKRALLSSDIAKYHFFEWRKDTKRFEKVSMGTSEGEYYFPQTEIVVSSLKKEIKSADYKTLDSTFFFEDLGFATYELLLFPAMQPFVIALAKPEKGNRITWHWPKVLLVEISSLSNQNEVFWMVRAKNEDGNVVASSKLMKLVINRI